VNGVNEMAPVQDPVPRKENPVPNPVPDSVNDSHGVYMRPHVPQAVYDAVMAQGAPTFADGIKRLVMLDQRKGAAIIETSQFLSRLAQFDPPAAQMLDALPVLVRLAAAGQIDRDRVRGLHATIIQGAGKGRRPR